MSYTTYYQGCVVLNSFLYRFNHNPAHNFMPFHHVFYLPQTHLRSLTFFWFKMAILRSGFTFLQVPFFRVSFQPYTNVLCNLLLLCLRPSSPFSPNYLLSSDLQFVYIRTNPIAFVISWDVSIYRINIKNIATNQVFFLKSVVIKKKLQKINK